MTKLNPFTLLDSVLADWASPRVRRLIHFILLVVVAAGAVYFAVGGDWEAFAASVVAALYTAANKANTPQE